ncbi:MAG: RNA repair transcriptional activator RtcR [Gammaproteobacteria bacterium]|nr:RNA repair transcriptional activator RtcR [Gammaproteobacteria bacterium]
MQTVVIGLLGTTLDRRGKGERRWQGWRPTVSVCQQEDFVVDRLELLFGQRYQGLADQVMEDIETVSPETTVRGHITEFADPWDFASVYSVLYDFSRRYRFQPETENYFIHITTGTHVAQICLYLLNETHYLPGRLLQTSPPSRARRRGSDYAMEAAGEYQIIDLDLSKYDQIASRFERERVEGTAYLKQGIETRSAAFNAMIEQIEQVSIRSVEPMLLTGPTGAGKSQLARLIYELKRQRGQFGGEFVSVNCATLRGDSVSSALFGHLKGAFTGATNHRPGLLRQAHDGMLFLDEIGELGLDEQAMLLHAIEEKTFMPVGADSYAASDFQLIAGTNRDLAMAVARGEFREDLLARINLWAYELPSLRQRIEDLEPNIDFELERLAATTGRSVSFSQEARTRYVSFATSAAATWAANFRDLNSSIKRMATLSDGGRISTDDVDAEIARLRERWQAIGPGPGNRTGDDLVGEVLGPARSRELDLFVRSQLSTVIGVCRASNSMAEAGRALFEVTRLQKQTTNDSHRVKQYLAKFGLTFDDLKRQDNTKQ